MCFQVKRDIQQEKSVVLSFWELLRGEKFLCVTDGGGIKLSDKNALMITPGTCFETINVAFMLIVCMVLHLQCIL